MARRFTDFIEHAAELAGADAATGDRIPVVTGGVTKYLDPSEIVDIPEIQAALAATSSYSDEEARDAIGAALTEGEAIDITVNDGANTITIACEDATTSNKGVVELAIDTEVNTGTSTALAVTPDALAGSYAGTKEISLEVIAAATTVTTGDGKLYFRVPTSLNGMNLVVCAAAVFAKSTSGTPTIQIARGRQSGATSAHSFVDMLSTRITIDANEFDSSTAATGPTIDTSNDDVATGDLIRIDVDTAGTGTTGLYVTMEFRLP